MASVRLLVTRAPAGRLEGSLTAVDGSAEHRFSGTLELLQLLEDLADADGDARPLEDTE